MRWTAGLKQNIWDRIETGLFVGDLGAPNGRVTVSADWRLEVTSPVYGNSLRGSYRYYNNPESVQHEIPSIKSIRINRSLNQDIATCQLTIYNAWHEANTSSPELINQLGKPGYFWPKRGDGDSGPTWNQSPSTGAYRKDGTWDDEFSWRNVLVEDALIFTYQGYGGVPKDGGFVSLDENLENENVVITGVWLADSVVGNHSGTMVINCRDVGRLLLDQIVFPPTIPTGLYPLEYVPAGRSRFDSLWGPRARSVPSSAYGSRGPVRFEAGNTSADGLTNDDFVGDHPLAAAIDGNIEDFYLTEAFDKRIDGPLLTSTAWFELEIPDSDQTVSSVAMTPWAGGYKVYVSVMVDGEWQGENDIPAPTGEGKDIPYVTEIYIPETTPGGDSQRGEPEVYAELRRTVDETESFYSGVLAGSDPEEHQRLYGKATQVEEGELVQFLEVQKVRVSFQRFYYSGMPNDDGDQFRAGLRTVKIYCLGQNNTPYEAGAGDLPWTWAIEKHPTRGYWVLENTGTVHGFGDAANYDSDSPTFDPLDDIEAGRRWLPWSIAPSLPYPYGANYDHGVDSYTAGTTTQSGSATADPNHVISGGQVYHRGQNRAHSMAATPSGKGYWVVDWHGRVNAYGDASLYGAGEFVVNPPERFFDWRTTWLEIYREGYNELRDGKGVIQTIDPLWAYDGVIGNAWCTEPRVYCTGIAATATGEGYWVLYSNGAVAAFGDAVDGGLGLTSSITRVNDATAVAFRGIQAKYLHYGRVSYGYTKDYYVSGKGTAIESHPKKKGFWVVDECGQVFNYGQADHFGHLVNRIYNAGAEGSFTLRLFDYAVDIVSTDTGEGYWILFNSGMIAPFGDAVVKGPLDLNSINKQYENNVAVGGTRFDTSYYRKLFYSMTRDQDGRGYWVLRADGEVYFYESTDWGNPGWNGLTGYRWHEGNFDGDYADIVKEIAMWAGFTYYEDLKDQPSLQTTVPSGFEGTMADYEQINVLGGIESTAIKQDIEITGDKWDKKLCIDVIRELAEVVGYIVYVDQEGGLRFRSPNWWRSGNFDYNGWRVWVAEVEGETVRIPEEYAEEADAQPFIPVIHEEVDLLAYSANLNNTDKRWQIIIGTDTPDPRDISKSAHVQHFPPFANEEVRPGVPSTRNIPRTSIWTSHIFENADERKLMAETIGIHNYFAGRTGTVTAVANPCLDVDDQIRIVERTTSETYIHRIIGMDTEMDLDEGTYTMSLQTHWLGSADNWVLVTSADGDPWDADYEGGYPEGARVSHEGVTYISTVAANDSEPGTNEEWVEQTSVDNPYVVISDQLDSWQRETDRGLQNSGYAATNPFNVQVTGSFQSFTSALDENGDPDWGIWYTGTGTLPLNNETTFPYVNYKSFGRGLDWPIDSVPPESYEDGGADYNTAKIRAAEQGFILTLGDTPDHLQDSSYEGFDVVGTDFVDITEFASSDALAAIDDVAPFSATFPASFTAGFSGAAFSFDFEVTDSGNDYEISAVILEDVVVDLTDAVDSGFYIAVSPSDAGGRPANITITGDGAASWTEDGTQADPIPEALGTVLDPVTIRFDLEMINVPEVAYNPAVALVASAAGGSPVPIQSVDVASVTFEYTEVMTTTETRTGVDIVDILPALASSDMVALDPSSDLTPGSSGGGTDDYVDTINETTTAGGTLSYDLVDLVGLGTITITEVEVTTSCDTDGAGTPLAGLAVSSTSGGSPFDSGDWSTTGGPVDTYAVSGAGVTYIGINDELFSGAGFKVADGTATSTYVFDPPLEADTTECWLNVLAADVDSFGDSAYNVETITVTYEVPASGVGITVVFGELEGGMSGVAWTFPDAPDPDFVLRGVRFNNVNVTAGALSAAIIAFGTPDYADDSLVGAGRAQTAVELDADAWSDGSDADPSSAYVATAGPEGEVDIILMFSDPTPTLAGDPLTGVVSQAISPTGILGESVTWDSIEWLWYLPRP